MQRQFLRSSIFSTGTHCVLVALPGTWYWYRVPDVLVCFHCAFAMIFANRFAVTNIIASPLIAYRMLHVLSPKSFLLTSCLALLATCVQAGAGLSLEETPSWRVILFLLGFLILSILVE